MNTRRSTRHLNRLGVRLSEEHGTVTTTHSRAAAAFESAKVKAIGYQFGIR